MTDREKSSNKKFVPEIFKAPEYVWMTKDGKEKERIAKNMRKSGLLAFPFVYVGVTLFFYGLFGAAVNATADEAWYYTIVAYSIGIAIVTITAALCYVNRKSPFMVVKGSTFLVLNFTSGIIAMTIAFVIAAVQTKNFRDGMTKTQTIHLVYSLLVVKAFFHQVLWNGSIICRQHVIYLIFNEKLPQKPPRNATLRWLKFNWKIWAIILFFFGVFVIPLSVWVFGGANVHTWWVYKIFPGYFGLTFIYLAIFFYLSWKTRGASKQYNDYAMNIRFELVYFWHCFFVCVFQQTLIMTKNQTNAIKLNGPVYATLYLVTLYCIDAFWVDLFYIMTGRADIQHTKATTITSTLIPSSSDCMDSTIKMSESQFSEKKSHAMKVPSSGAMLSVHSDSLTSCNINIKESALTKD